MHDTYRIVDDNLIILRQGLDLIGTLTDELYCAQPHGRASVGSHMRHVVDFFDNFLRGAVSGSVNYDARSRDREVEQNRALARDRLALVIGALELGDFAADRGITVKLDAMLPADDPRAWSHSTLHRELQGLVSHTIHHYALISMTLAWLGETTPAHFGVAPSTIEYRQGQGMSG